MSDLEFSDFKPLFLGNTGKLSGWEIARATSGATTFVWRLDPPHHGVEYNHKNLNTYLDGIILGRFDNIPNYSGLGNHESTGSNIYIKYGEVSGAAVQEVREMAERDWEQLQGKK